MQPDAEPSCQTDGSLAAQPEKTIRGDGQVATETNEIRSEEIATGEAPSQGPATTNDPRVGVAHSETPPRQSLDQEGVRSRQKLSSAAASKSKNFLKHLNPFGHGKNQPARPGMDLLLFGVLIPPSRLNFQGYPLPPALLACILTWETSLG